ncbi:hypothetical protein RZS08_30095, partial [Arthrospira platensis SPKY1]|nr:hypothetical protein [Arthrospira platensis SPKY1]
MVAVGDPAAGLDCQRSPQAHQPRDGGKDPFEKICSESAESQEQKKRPVASPLRYRELPDR